MDKLYNIPYLEDYLINKKGELYSKKSNKFIKSRTSGRGYVGYNIFVNKKKGFISRHRLLCSVFKPVKNWEKLTVDHINGIPGDDRLENIEFVTIKENVKRYWKNRFSRQKPKRPITIKSLVNGKYLDCEDFIEAASKLRVHRYEILRRLSLPFGFVFKDYTMIKYKDDPREFPVYKNLEEARRLMSPSTIVKGYNHITKEFKVFRTMTEAGKFLGKSSSTLTMKLTRDNKIFSNGWELKYYDDNTPWSKPSEEELNRITKGCITFRPICVTNIKTNKKLYFNNCRDACRYFKNGTPTKIWYRLKVNSKKPSRDGFIYNYL